MNNSNITIKKGDVVLEHTMFLFPGGEVGVKLDAHNLRYFSDKALYQTVIARIQNSNDVMELVMVTDALRRLHDLPTKLILPYIPYGRQDRVCVEGESLSVKAFADVINGLGFEEVLTFDPHSAVTEAVFDNLVSYSQKDVINAYGEFVKRVLMLPNALFVAPDAGANKKTSDLASYFNHGEFIRADKLRELSTGKIKETIVYADDLKGVTCIIADDIADGGRTFIELSKVLKAKGAQQVILYVTHGIFSQGVEALMKGGIDEVWTTNSYRTSAGSLNVLNLETAFKL